MTAFLCDDMLGGVARWMRAAGHDTAMALPHASDSALISQAQREERALVTCDKRMIREREDIPVPVLLLHSNRPARAGPELSARYDFDWLWSPFTRCMVDNARLRGATPEEAAGLPHAPGASGPVRTCPACRRLYWRGSHTDRIRHQLERWQALRRQLGP